MRRLWKTVLLLCLVLLMGACSEVEDVGDSLNPKAMEKSSEEIAEPEGAYNPLTGEYGMEESADGRRPVAIMVSNQQKSLPQWGVSEADIIYEAVTEGGITRLMCVFADADAVPKIGPVRSAREYYPQFSEPLGAIYVHFGGSTTGYAAISDYGIEDVDGISYSALCGRDASRADRGKEHTYYTDAEMLAGAIAAKGYSMELNAPEAYHFGEASLHGGAANSVSVTYSNFTATFEYNAESGKYLRFQHGDAHVDANNDAQVAVDNVFVVYADTYLLEDGVLTRYVLDSGTGVYISGGKQQTIHWTKGAYNQMFRFTDESGKEITVNPGSSWVCMIPSSKQGATVIE